MAELIACAAIGSMIVATRHSPKIARLDKLVHGGGDLLGGHLTELGHLDLLLLIVFLELDDGFVCEINQHVWWLTSRFLEQAANSLSLIYKY